MTRKSHPENRGKTFEKRRKIVANLGKNDENLGKNVANLGKMMKILENLRTNRGNSSKIRCFDHKAGEFE